MANQYTARVTATLVSGSLQKAIEAQAKSAKINLQNVQVNASSVINEIQKALNNHSFKINVQGLQQQGQQAGQQFVAGVNSQLKNIGVGIGGIKNMQNMLQQWGLNPADIDKVTNHLSHMSVAITKIKTSLGSNGNIKMTITGVDELGRVVTQVKEFDRASGQISNAGRTITQTFGSVTSASKSASEALRKQKEEAKEYADAVKKANTEALTLTRSSTLSNNIQAWMNKNTQAAKVFENELKDIQSRLSNNSSASMLQRCAAEFQNVQAKAKAANLTVKGFQDTFINIGSKVGNFALQMAGLGSAYQIGMKMINSISNGIKTVVDLDTALIDLRKTAKMSSGELSQFYFDANTEAKNLGVTTQEIIEQAAAWSRLGYSTADEVKTMARLSSQFAQISPGMSTTEAQEALVSTMKAFKDEIPDVNSVLDGIMSKINIVGNSFAISNKDIADALQVSSSSMSAANNTFEQTVALITAGTEITQDASRVGNGLRTISMRIRGLNEETGEFDEELGNVKNDISELTHGLVSIMEDDNTYKSTYDILDRIAQIWDQLTDKEQAGLMEKLFGKNRAQIGVAILSNFQTARDAIDQMAHSAGNADKEMGIIMESLSYKSNALKQTWVGIWQTIAGRKELGSVIDGLTKVSEAIGFIIDKFGLLGTIAGAGALVLLIKNFKTLKELFTGVMVAGGGADKLLTFLSKLPAMMTGLASSPLMGIAAVGGAIFAAVKLYQELNPTLERVTAETEELNSKVVSLNESYETNSKRIEELNKLKEQGNISVKEDAELARLQAQNDVIDTQIKLYQQLYEEKKKEQADVARKEANALLDSSNDPGTWGVNDTLAFYNNAKRQLRNAKPGSYASNQYSKQVELYGNRLSDEIESISQIIELLDAEKDSVLIAELTDLMNSISDSINDGATPAIKDFKDNLKSLSEETRKAFTDMNIGDLTEEQIDEIIKWMDECGYSVDDLKQHLLELNGVASDSFSQTVQKNIGDLTSFRDELAATSQALADYNKAMEGGEKGDSIASMQEIYKGAMEDLNAGKLDTNRLHAAASLFFSPEQLAAMNYDMAEIGKQLQSSMMKSLFDPTGQSAQTAGQRMVQYIKDNASAFDKIAQVEDLGNGKINFFYNSLKDLADAFGMSEGAMAAFLDEWDAYGVNVMRSTEENQKLISQYEQLVTSTGNAKAAVEELANQMHGEGSDILEIGNLMKDLQNAGIIKLDDSELNKVLENVFSQFSTLEDSDPTTTAHLEGNQAINDAQSLRQRLEAILSPPITIPTSVSGSAPAASSTPSSFRTRHNFAEASGTDNAQGGDTLVNELGPELISDNGKAYIANGGKPGFTKLSKGAIVFNAEETEQIFKYGFRDIPFPAMAEGTNRKGLIGRMIGGLIAKAKAYAIGGAEGASYKKVTVNVKKCPRCGSSVASGIQICPYCSYNFAGGGYLTSGTKTYTTTNSGTSSVTRWSSPSTVSRSSSSYTSYTANQGGNLIPNTTISSGSGSTGGGYDGGSGGSGGYGGGSDSSSRSDPQKVDWIAVRLDRLNRAVQDLEKIANSAFKNLGKRLGAAKSEITTLNKEIEANNKGYERYIKEANSVGLDAGTAELVKSGAIDITKYDDDTRQKIEEYKEW